ncbi:hypothetical protein KFK09_025075 [Dendrobium nobile]|uniref:DUF4283 domain-containing protein n=1 Tax=Dendrobium nobile TaxID=94219 RepID=A0A8T3AFG2_DENNO|nr:hypothetical protein KFK09_025075 [Dendrobium nobile]
MHLAKPFEFALVGKFPLKRLVLDAIRRFFFNLKLSGDFSVTLLDQSNVLIKLANDLDYGRVFAHRSYFVYGCFMKIVKWSPTLDLSEESPVVPVWISFPGLRPHLFSSRILFGLGSVFGRPIQTDNATAVGSRPSVARILVELDISKKYPDSVWLGPKKLGYVQKVVIEGLPNFCQHCKVVGHKKSDCTKLYPNLRSVVTVAPPPLNSLSEPLPNPNTLDFSPITNEPSCEVVSGNGVVIPGLGELNGLFDINLEQGVVLPSVVVPVSSPGTPISLENPVGVGGTVFSELRAGVLAAADGIEGVGCSVLPVSDVLADSSSDAVNRSNAANDFLLSPNAIPFMPSVLLDGCDCEDSPTISLVPEVPSVEVNVVNSDASPVLGVVNSNGGVQDFKHSDDGVDGFVSAVVVPIGIEAEFSSLGGVDGNMIANSLVEVPVCEVDPHVLAKCVGSSASLVSRPDSTGTDPAQTGSRPA